MSTTQPPKIGHYTRAWPLESDYRLLNQTLSDFQSLLVTGTSGAPDPLSIHGWSIQRKLVHLQRIVLITAVVFGGGNGAIDNLRPWVVHLIDTFGDSDFSYEEATERLGGATAPAQTSGARD